MASFFHSYPVLPFDPTEHTFLPLQEIPDPAAVMASPPPNAPPLPQHLSYFQSQPQAQIQTQTQTPTQQSLSSIEPDASIEASIEAQEQTLQPPASATNLVDLLSTDLVFHQIVPHLPIDSILALSKASRATWHVIHQTPHSFRHLDLSNVAAAKPGGHAVADNRPYMQRLEAQNPAYTHSVIYSLPLNKVFDGLARRNLLQDVQTLILDGLSVTAELVNDIIMDERYSVRLLSIRRVTAMNEAQLRQVLRYAARPTRPKGMPRLRGLYFFSPLENESRRGSKPLNADPDAWFKTSGKLIDAPSREWAETIQHLQGIIAFDATLCRGPRHNASTAPFDRYLGPAVANVALGPTGCERCLSLPELHQLCITPAAERTPLLVPPPFHESTINAAIKPTSALKVDPTQPFLRCEECLRERWCERCNRWWCEDCFPHPERTSTIEKVKNGICFEYCGDTRGKLLSELLATVRHRRAALDAAQLQHQHQQQIPMVAAA
jgi:hypothetical protein